MSLPFDFHIYFPSLHVGIHLPAGSLGIHLMLPGDFIDDFFVFKSNLFSVILQVYSQIFGIAFEGLLGGALMCVLCASHDSMATIRYCHGNGEMLNRRTQRFCREFKGFLQAWQERCSGLNVVSRHLESSSYSINHKQVIWMLYLSFTRQAGKARLIIASASANYL